MIQSIQLFQTDKRLDWRTDLKFGGKKHWYWMSTQYQQIVPWVEVLELVLEEEKSDQCISIIL